MATQAQSISGRLVRQERAIEKPPSGIIPQLFAVVVRPRFFFRVMPRGRSWIVAGILMLAIVGFTATRQVSSTTRSLVSPTTTTQTLGAQGGFGGGRNFNRNQTGATTDQTAAGTSTTGAAATPAASGASTSGTGRNFAPPANTTTDQSTAPTPAAAGSTSTSGTGRNFAPPADAQTPAGGVVTTSQTATTAQTGPIGAAATDTTAATTPLTATSTLTSALLAAGSILIMWLGQAVLLSLVPMLRGFKPQFSRALQIAVWATIPLAIMLILRQIFFAAGGTGGMTGLSLLLTRWSGYASLPELAQRVLTTFMSNLSLFWIWGLLLLYFGAREALRGRRWTAIVVIVMWVAVSTVVPALVAQPVTNVVPRATTTQTTAATGAATTNRTTTTTGAATQFGGGAFPAGGFTSGNFGGGTGNTRTNRGG